VEGAQPLTLAHNAANNTLQIAKHLACRNPHHREPKLLQIAIPPVIPLLPCCTIMSLAIYFDTKPYRETCEVNRKGTLRALLAKAVSTGPLL
jgi:hypothetical protein